MGGRGVSLINLDGLVLIGPGSEWLWSFLSDVALVVTLAGVFFQLRADRATRAFDQTMAIRAEWASRAERHARLVALIDLEGRPIDDGLPLSAFEPANWFDRLGGLVMDGHVSLDQVGAIIGPEPIWWWLTCEPYVRHDRIRFGTTALLNGFEFLMNAMQRRFREETGGLPTARLAVSVAEEIERYTALLQRDLDLERGVIPRRRPDVIETTPAGRSEAPA